MIHIATVHWQTDKWIPIQDRFLKRHLAGPWRVYAWLNDLPSVDREQFYFSRVEPVQSHAAKLNALADVICNSPAPADDIILFLDGDAFPIAPLDAFLRSTLDRFRLTAVQRLENDGDSQPHPCFCATTVGFWRSIKGDWSRGFEWRNRRGRLVTDVGGNLLKQLNDARAPWHPMLRTNGKNLHPVFFGIYDRIVYHHGSGFRAPICRCDYDDQKLRSLFARVLRMLPIPNRGALAWRLFRNVVTQNAALSESLFETIKVDGDFVRSLA